jgi:hypothetical protein
MQYFRHVVDTPHPGNIALDFKVVLDATDPKQVTLNGSDVSAWLNSWPGGYDFSQAVAVNQPSMGINEIVWEDPVILQHLHAGGDYLFFDAVDTDGAFVFALARSDRTSPDTPRVFDFGEVAPEGWGMNYASEYISGYTPTSYGGAAVTKRPIATSTDYRSIGFVAEFGSIERVYVENTEEASQAITLLDLRDAYIVQAPVRAAGGGPMCIGIQAKTTSQTGRNFYNGAMKSILIGAGIPSAYERELIQKYHNAKGAA